MKPPKVSVVVPVYNVERYIERCVDSILGQTYNNIEVILVNDGSPDRCGSICDRYKKADARVKVLHKKNGGLSDARNHGMQLVTGEYTMFVDSDDWIRKEMIEDMVAVSLAYRADIVQSDYYYAYEDRLEVYRLKTEDESAPLVLDQTRLMAELIRNRIVKNFAWGKLCKSNIVKEIPFEKGVLFEDVLWAYKVMHNVKQYVVLHKPMYYYYQRNDSIVGEYSPKNLDFLWGLQERHRFIEAFYKDLVNCSYKEIFKHSLIHFNLLFLHSSKDRDGTYRRNLRKFIDDNYAHFRAAVSDDEDLKLQLLFFKIHPYVNMSYLGMKRVLRRLGLLKSKQGLLTIVER